LWLKLGEEGSSCTPNFRCGRWLWSFLASSSGAREYLQATARKAQRPQADCSVVFPHVASQQLLWGHLRSISDVRIPHQLYPPIAVVVSTETDRRSDIAGQQDMAQHLGCIAHPHGDVRRCEWRNTTVAIASLLVAENFPWDADTNLSPLTIPSA
jgi:hypothetical protein